MEPAALPGGHLHQHPTGHTYTVWGVEPVVTHQTSSLEGTDVCGLQQNQADGNSVMTLLMHGGHDASHAFWS